MRRLHFKWIESIWSIRWCSSTSLPPPPPTKLVARCFWHGWATELWQRASNPASSRHTKQSTYTLPSPPFVATCILEEVRLTMERVARKPRVYNSARVAFVITHVDDKRSARQLFAQKLRSAVWAMRVGQPIAPNSITKKLDRRGLRKSLSPVQHSVQFSLWLRAPHTHTHRHNSEVNTHI